jgi:hypothetical protein
MRIDLTTKRYYEIADRDDLSYEEKLAEYGALADRFFDTERYREFCDKQLGEIDNEVAAYISSPEFDKLLVETVTATFPAHEHDLFVEHYRGLLKAWVNDQK